MAAFSEMAPKKRLTTYGKTSRKRLPGFGHFTQVENTRAVSEVSEDANGKFQSPPVQDVTASVDIFDVPSSDDEKAPPSGNGKRKLGKTYSRATTPLKKSRTESPPAILQSIPPKKGPMLASKRTKTIDQPGLKASNTTSTKSPALEAKKVVNKTIVTPAKMLTQSELRMSTVRHASVERTTKQSPVKGELVRPRRGLVSRPAKSGQMKLNATTVVDQMASVTINTPKKNTYPDLDTVMSTPPPYITSNSSTPSPIKGRSPTPRQPSISPKGKRMWQGLLNEAAPEAAPAKKPSFERTIVDTRIKKPKRRIIDKLMEQREDSEEESEVEDEHETEPMCSQQDTQLEVISNPQWEDTQPRQIVPIHALSAGPISQTNGPRTYATQQRAILAEPVRDFESELAMDMPLESVGSGKRQARGGIPSLKPIESLHEAEDAISGVAIRSIHELRMAGAKNHFVDGVEHLLSDIGAPQAKPSSSRRSGLMELAAKLLEKDYRRQCLENGLEQRLFLHLGQETDIVSGYLIVSILFIVLTESAHSLTIDQLRRQGISRLLVRLLEVQQSVTRISRDRKSNMSKSAQSLILEYQTSLLKSEMWGEPDQSSISPRTMALRCIELMVKQTREAGNAGDIISKEMTSKLFGILKDPPADTLSELSKNKDFQLALSTLESHSQKGMSGDVAAWTTLYLPYLSDILLRTLTQREIPLQMEEELEDCFFTLVKLVLSVTHDNEEAANVFSTPEFMSATGKAIVANWRRMSGFLLENERATAINLLTHLTPMMMNIVDASHLARRSFGSLAGTEDDSLAGMVRIFNDREESSSQADSLEKTGENIPLGYLSFVLGFLCLEAEIKDRVTSELPDRRMGPLISFIKDFLMMFKAVDEAQDIPSHKSHAEVYKSLEAMIDTLTNPYK